MGGGNVPGAGTHEGEGVLGGGDGVAGGRVHDDHAVAVGGVTVDVVHADSGAADGFELFRGGEDLGSDLGLGADDERVVVADDGDQLIGGEANLEVGGDVRMGIEQFDPSFADGVRDEDAFSSHELRPEL